MISSGKQGLYELETWIFAKQEKLTGLEKVTLWQALGIPFEAFILKYIFYLFKHSI